MSNVNKHFLNQQPLQIVWRHFKHFFQGNPLHNAYKRKTTHQVVIMFKQSYIQESHYYSDKKDNRI